ncbi:MAG: 2,5-diketo-D-gluconate reductase A [Bradymonadia bacterium]|jgi:2,5-diketo-D-gluconate reductase A
MADHTFPLTNHAAIPAVGFGTYLIPVEDVATVVGAALRQGYRHIDTAEGYRNEAAVGDAIAGFLDESGLTRAELFVTTKLWPGNPAWGMPTKDYEGTLTAFEKSLEELGLDYVDLYLIHTPFAGEMRTEQWRALVELKKQGKARAIGVSNYDQEHIEEIRAAGLPLPDANQVELHPWSQKTDLIGYLKQNSIQPIAYSSLLPLSSWRSVEGQESAKTEEMKADAETAPFKKLAAKYDVSEAQVLLRWAVQSGFAILPKSTNTKRMAANKDLFGFHIDDADMAAIETMDRGAGVAWISGDPMQTA